MLFCGFAAFFIYRLTSDLWKQPGSDLIIDAQFVVLIILAVVWLSLRRRCSIACRYLRVHELLVFGPPAAFMLLLEKDRMSQCAQHGFLQNPIGPWFALIFTYALFIPNYLAAERPWSSARWPRRRW